jgi:hypothetical protein
MRGHFKFSINSQLLSMTKLQFNSLFNFWSVSTSRFSFSASCYEKLINYSFIHLFKFEFNVKFVPYLAALLCASWISSPTQSLIASFYSFCGQYAELNWKFIYFMSSCNFQNINKWLRERQKKYVESVELKMVKK